jgi:hypothetical protein
MNVQLAHRKFLLQETGKKYIVVATEAASSLTI